MARITRDSWEMIAENIIDIIDNNKDLDDACEELERYLTDEKIIEIIPD